MHLSCKLPMLTSYIIYFYQQTFERSFLLQKSSLFCCGYFCSLNTVPQEGLNFTVHQKALKLLLSGKCSVHLRGYYSGKPFFCTITSLHIVSALERQDMSRSAPRYDIERGKKENGKTYQYGRGSCSVMVSAPTPSLPLSSCLCSTLNLLHEKTRKINVGSKNQGQITVDQEAFRLHRII